MNQHTCICTECGQTFKKRAKATAIAATYTEQDRELCHLLFESVIANYPFLADKPPTAKDYAEMNKLARLDGKPYPLIEVVINWCQQNDFWKQNIRSVAKLRKQFDTLMVQAKSEHDAKKRGVTI